MMKEKESKQSAAERLRDPALGEDKRFDELTERALTTGDVSGVDNNDRDALNPMLAGGQMTGSHQVNVNEQTDIELGALADPGGMDPALEEQQMAKDFKKIRERLKNESNEQPEK